MKLVQLVQGSPEWHAHRRNHFNASDAPAMMGCSPYKSRTELLHELATGLTPEVGADLQRRYDAGHRSEALARPLAEKIVGEELYPVVGVEGRLSASFDGLTMMYDTASEHKSLNETLRACMRQQGGSANDFLPLFYLVQMEQQSMVSKCERVLFMASKWEGETLIEERHCWYTPDPALAERIAAGWARFAEDLAAYTPTTEAAPAPAGRAPDTLPALRIEVTGAVTASNLAEFKETALAAIRSVNRTLSTDADFADAEKAVKWCGDVESRLSAAKEHALSQTATIDALFKTIDDISAEARRVRLELDKLVKTRKESVRGEIVAGAQTALDQHMTALNARLGAPWIARTFGAFGESVKGKKTVASVKDAVATALANAKIEMSAQADRLDANRKSLVIDGKDWFFLFADFSHVGNAPAETFSAIAAQRIQKQQLADKVEADRVQAIKDAAEAKCLAEEAKAAEPVEPTPASAPIVAQPPAVVIGAFRGTVSGGYGRVAETTASPVVDTRPPITTGALGDFLGFAVKAEFVERLGIKPASLPANVKKAGTYWNIADLPAIKAALVRHIAALPDVPAVTAAREAVPA